MKKANIVPMRVLILTMALMIILTGCDEIIITIVPEFPSGLIGTWRRSTYTSTLTFTSTTLRASNQTSYWTVEKVSGNTYTIRSNASGTSATITIRLESGNLVISGDSGSGENNWNGTWTTSTINLTYNSWYSNTLSAGQTHYYRFYATAGTYNVEWQDSDNSSYSADVVVSVKREGASSYIVQRTDSGSNTLNIIGTSGYVIIEVEGYNSSSRGTYRIRYY